MVVVIQLHSNRPMKRAGEAGKALRAGGGADFIFSAPERVVMAFRLFAGALVCLWDVLCGGERVRA
ncbi:hypothetical protein [Escherichia coli]|uniref:hypothetical protein n=1 Tax=Escherichia coli TaxID=562 RepID=UPI0011E994D1|nr:hypothetical protein [Escherichia coli]EEC8284824.1 hypothetical protein [Escherichia coli]EFU6000853.1 hypothetical protein [Escherichia coli]EIG6406173.1 hypothetical protein [Escherichia coli]ELO4351485.1 hypothetical protein [Escherichia coli]MCV5178432.1 hypothetical protein [Escherichia coli]